MALPGYTKSTAAFSSLFSGVKAAAQRELVKAQARFWDAAGKGLDAIDTKIAQPALKARNAVVDTAATAGKSVLGGLKIGTVILMLIAAGVAFLYIRPFLPSRK